MNMPRNFNLLSGLQFLERIQIFVSGANLGDKLQLKLV